MQNEIVFKESKEAREKEVYDKSQEVLQYVVSNLLAPEGLTALLDDSLEVDRKKIIAKVLKDMATQLEKE